MVEVRWARRSEAPQVYALFRALVIAEQSEPTTPATFALAWKRSFTAGGFRFVVAIDGTKLVGCMSLHAHYSTWKGAPVVSLEDFYVLPEERGKGIGSQMLAFADAYATELKAARIELHVRKDNERAYALYKRSGYEDTPYIWLNKFGPVKGQPAPDVALLGEETPPPQKPPKQGRGRRGRRR